MAKKKKISKQKKKQENRENENKYQMIKPNFDPVIKRWIGTVILFGLAFFSLFSFLNGAGKIGGYLNDGLELAFGWGAFMFPIILILVGYYLFTKEKRASMATRYIGIFLLTVSFLGILHLFYLDRGREAVVSGLGGGYIGYGVSYGLNQMMGFWGSLIVLGVLFLISTLIILEQWIVKLKDRRMEEQGSLFNIGGWWTRLRYKLAGYRNDGEIDTDDDPSASLDTARDRSFGAGRLKQMTTDMTPLVGSLLIRGETDRGVETAASESGIRDASGKNIDGVNKKEIVRKKKIKIDLPMNLLTNASGQARGGDTERNKNVIHKTLQNFGIEVEMGGIKVGPTVTQYTLRPAEGVKLSKIVTLQNDLSLALAAHPIRIEAPIPGKSLVGIEVPNEVTATVALRELLETKEFKERESNLTFGLGQDVSGHPWLVQLNKLPHLLIAGATGSGKSVCLNSIIVSLLYQNSSDDLKFILVDPKRVELTTYNKIPHLLTPVITDVPKVIKALKWTVGEMERRFHILSEAGKRDIITYNRDSGQSMPYIIFAIDELADLMTAAGSEVEGLIIRLAQMSRAVGIHLILATQRPSVDIITGLIKANIPARIAFSVASLVDSRTILDTSGAEKLLGRGDMLYISADISKPRRLQGAYLSDRDIENVIRYLRERSEPDYNNEIVETTVSPGNFGNVSAVDIGNEDELLEEAKETVKRAGKASASLLQRRLRVGYARAARLLDLMEEQGFIGPADGARPREVYAEKDEDIEDVENVEDVKDVEGEENVDNSDFNDFDNKGEGYDN